MAANKRRHEPQGKMLKYTGISLAEDKFEASCYTLICEFWIEFESENLT